MWVPESSAYFFASRFVLPEIFPILIAIRIEFLCAPLWPLCLCVEVYGVGLDRGSAGEVLRCCSVNAGVMLHGGKRVVEVMQQTPPLLILG